MTGFTPLDRKSDLSDFTGEFIEPELEQEFRVSQLPDTLRHSEFLFGVGAAVGMVFLVANLVALGRVDVLHVVLPRMAQFAVSLGCLLVVRRGRGNLVGPLIIVWGVTLTLCAATLLTVQQNVAQTVAFLLPAIFYTTVPTAFRTTIVMGASSSAILFAAYLGAGLSAPHRALFLAALLLMNILLGIVRARSGRSLRTQWMLTRAYRQALADREAHERQLRATEAEYRALFENAVVGIYRSTPDGRLLRANPALAHLHGYTTEDELLSAVNDIASEWYVERSRRDEWKRLMSEAGRVVDFVSEIHRHRTRERIWISETSWTIRGHDNEVLYFEGTVVEATERKRLDAEIRHLAQSDELTELPNRRLLRDRLEQASASQRRHGTPFAVMYLDLDRFKAVNDAFGHSAGDVLLKEAARRLKLVSRSEDTVARIGGDEFAVVCVGFENRRDLVGIAERVLEAFREPFSVEGPRALVGTSIGIALAPIDGTDPEELMKKADDALYRAKAEGRNTYRFFSQDVGAVPAHVPPLARARN